jgi:hypothetical protein
MGRAPPDVGGTAAISAGKTGLDHLALRSLYDQSHRWAAGLVLMLEQLRRTGAVNHISQSETIDTVFDYFAGQIFDPSPVGTRDFSHADRVLAERHGESGVANQRQSRRSEHFSMACTVGTSLSSDASARR